MSVNRFGWRSFIVCFFIAAALWILEAFNKEYTVPIKISLRFAFNSKQYTPVGLLPKAIKINVRGMGWEILQRQFQQQSITLTLEDSARVQVIAGNTLLAALEPVLKNLKVEHTLADTVRVVVDRKTSRRLRVIADLTSVSYAVGFSLWERGAQVAPTSITVEGPQSVVQSLPAVVKAPVTAHDLNKKFREENVKINASTLPQLTYSLPLRATVWFEVVELLEISRSVRLVAKGNMQRKIVSRLPDSVRCVLRIPKNKAALFLQSEGIAALIDETDFKNGFNGFAKAAPHIVGLPHYAQLVLVDSIIIQHR